MHCESKTAFNIRISDQGEFSVTDAEGKELKELSPEELGESLVGREIKNARLLPVTFLSSNPVWICVCGRWYCIG